MRDNKILLYKQLAKMEKKLHLTTSVTRESNWLCYLQQVWLSLAVADLNSVSSFLFSLCVP